MRMGDRSALLRGGQLVQEGTAEEIYLKPKDLFAAGFFSEINVFHGKVRGNTIDLPIGVVSAQGLSEGRAATVAVRLSGFDLSSQAGERQARILSRRYLGVVELMELAVAGTETPVRARVRCGALPAHARDIWVTVRQPDVLVFETQAENA